MKIPWRKNSKSSPTTSTTKVVDDHHHSNSYNIGNSICSVVENYDGGVDVTMMKMMMVNSNHKSRSTIVTTTAANTTPNKPTIRCCNGDGISNMTNTTPITSSPTLLGSGHYSPVDGSVQTFAPITTSTLTNDDDVVVSTTTTTTTLLDHTSVFIQPTSLIFDQRSDDDYDVYLTPLQSSMASIDESTTGSSRSIQRNEHEYIHKTIPLTVAESTLTDITTDATVDGEDVKDDILRIGDSDDGPTTFVVPPPPPSTTTTTVAKDVIEAVLPPSKSPTFLRHASSFLRVSDLIGMDPTMDFSEHSHKSIPNYHCCSDTPPPGIPHDHMEQWVALDDGCRTDKDDTEAATMSSYTPIAQFAVDALATTALATIFDATMWVPDSKTAKIIEAKPITSWEASTFQQNPSPISTNHSTSTTQLEDHILIWSGTFRHGLYGSEIPAIRSAAVIYMSATKLLHLLMDSNRVKEYNTMSLGRTDLLTLPCRHIVTKVMRSESRPPLLRKTLQFTSIFHARKMNVDDDSNNNNNNNDSTNMENDSYLLVTRAVENPTITNATGSETNGANNNNNVVVSEILLGVNVIRSIPHQHNACVLLSVNHVRSPMVPSLFLAKRLGLQAATNFVHDLRKCC